MDADPARLLICSGFTHALAILCLALRRDGVGALAVEDPCAPRYRELVRTMGLDVVPVACDADGLRVDLLASSGARAVLVTPAHQYRLGVTMSAARRTALEAWARTQHALIIEDDYDGEFRYDRQPVGALQPLDPEHVAYVGSASKTLAPGLRLGWLAVPDGRVRAVAAMKENLDRGGAILDQLTFAEFIDSGAFDRQIRRMRTVYRRRRDELAREIAAHQARPGLAGIGLAGIAAGLHAVIYLPEHCGTADRLRDRAARNSIALDALTGYWVRPPEPCPQAIVVGFGTQAGHAYRPGLRALARLLETVRERDGDRRDQRGADL